MRLIDDLIEYIHVNNKTGDIDSLDYTKHLMQSNWGDQSCWFWTRIHSVGYSVDEW